MNKRGYVLTWDALIALAFMLMISTGLISLQYFRSISYTESVLERIHITSEDALEAINKKGILEQIGFLWTIGNFSNKTELETGNIHGASYLAKEYLDQIVKEPLGYRLQINNDTIYDTRYSNDTKRSDEETASDKTRALRIVSGYMENTSRGGLTARAWLEKNASGEINDMSPGPSPFTPRQLLLLEYSSAGNKTVYLKVPLGVRILSAELNLSWNGTLATTTTTTTTVTVPP